MNFKSSASEAKNKKLAIGSNASQQVDQRWINIEEDLKSVGSKLPVFCLKGQPHNIGPLHKV